MGHRHPQELLMEETPIARTSRSSAIATIKTEHRALGEVLRLAQHLLRNIAAGHADPDFELLCVAFYYIDDFACRCHHPKEEQYLFAAIRRHVPETRNALFGLQSEH